MKRMLYFLVMATVLVFSVCADECAVDNGRKEVDVKIRITVGESVLSATMYNNPTAYDFISMLPLTLTLEDYAGTEKISYLPRRLTTECAPDGSDPSVGDITYYAPWGNLSISYRDFGYSRGLVKLGVIDSGFEALHHHDSMRVTIECIKE